MADPCAQLVVTSRLKIQHAAPELLHPCAPFGCFHACFWCHGGVHRAFSKKPNSSAEEGTISICRATHFLSGHWMTREKSGLVWKVIVACGTFAKDVLYTSNVGHELMWLQDRGQLLEPFENGENGTTEQYQITFTGRGEGLFSNHINGCAAESNRGLSGVAIPTNNGSIKTILTQR